MTITLLDYANDRLQHAADETARTQADLTRAQQDRTAAQKKADDAAQKLATLQTAAAQIRQKIAATTNVADGQALFLQLEQNTVDTRSAQLELANAQAELADAASRIAGAGDEIDRTATTQKTVQDDVGAIQKRNADHTAWRSAATSPPLSGLPTKADATTAGEAKTAADAAKARLTGANGDIPQPLFDLAEARWKAEAKRIDDTRKVAIAAQDALAAEQKKGGLAGTAEQTRLAFERAETALKDFALTAQDRYERALALLAGVGDTNRAKLNADEKKRIADLGKEIADLKAGNPSVDVIQLQVDRDAARAKLDADYAALAKGYLDSIAADPSADPEATAAVKNARQAIATDAPDLDQKQTAYDAQKIHLERWEASVPDATWQLLADYEEALAILADLKAVGDPKANRVDPLTTAEDAYATALIAQKDNERKIVAVGDVARERTDRWTTAAQTRPTRLLGALRGDE